MTEILQSLEFHNAYVSHVKLIKDNSFRLILPLQRTPDYESTYVFTNDFPALHPDAPEPPASKDPLFQMAPAKGTCRVICYSPRTDVTMGIMAVQDIVKIIEM